MYYITEYKESPTNDYGVGDYVYYDGKVYRANGFVPAGPFDPSKWDELDTKLNTKIGIKLEA